MFMMIFYLNFVKRHGCNKKAENYLLEARIFGEYVRKFGKKQLFVLFNFFVLIRVPSFGARFIIIHQYIVNN